MSMYFFYNENWWLFLRWWDYFTILQFPYSYIPEHFSFLRKRKQMHFSNQVDCSSSLLDHQSAVGFINWIKFGLSESKLSSVPQSL